MYVLFCILKLQLILLSNYGIPENWCNANHTLFEGVREMTLFLTIFIPYRYISVKTIHM